jgi:hypothetical protein
MAEKSPEMQRFERALKKVLSVSKEEMNRRLAASRAEREQIPREHRPGQRPGPRPKKR